MKSIKQAVIPLGAKSGWPDYGELRYTLRALDKYSDVDVLMILGYKPTWIKNILHEPVPDCYKRNKDANLINKVLYASTMLTGDFIRLSDDQIILKEFDPQHYYNRKHVLGSLNGKWYKRLDNTMKLIGNKDFYNYDTHMPVVINNRKFIKVAVSVPYGEGIGCCINSMYFNFLEEKGKKIPKGYDVTPASVSAIKEDTYCLNIKDRCLTKEFKQWLDVEFPFKSKFEK